MTKQEKFKFTAEEFWALMENQKKHCALTNRELTPLSCEVELKDPQKNEDRFKLDNFYLVCRELKFLCRNLNERDIIELCAEIIKHRGKEYGLLLQKRKVK